VDETSSEDRERLQKGFDDFWNTFELVGEKAKVIKTVPKEQKKREKREEIEREEVEKLEKTELEEELEKKKLEELERKELERKELEEPKTELSKKESLIVVINKIYEILREVEDKLCEDQKKKFEKLRKKIEEAIVRDTPFQGTMTKENRIDIVFDPKKSKKVTPCDKIVFIQVVQNLVDGNPMKPGDFCLGWKYRDKVSTRDSRYVDFFKLEKDPYYNGDDSQDIGTSGESDSKKKNATMDDTPFDSFTDGSKNANTVTFKFETFAFCAKGKDCGKYFEGINWEYTRTKDDVKNGKEGISRITGARDEPSKGFKEAVKKWMDKYKFKPCEKKKKGGHKRDKKKSRE